MWKCVNCVSVNMCTCQMCKSEQCEWVSVQSCETENARICYWNPCETNLKSCEISEFMLLSSCYYVQRCLESMLGIIGENGYKIAWLFDHMICFMQYCSFHV